MLIYQAIARLPLGVAVTVELLAAGAVRGAVPLVLCRLVACCRRARARGGAAAAVWAGNRNTILRMLRARRGGDVGVLHPPVPTGGAVLPRHPGTGPGHGGGGARGTVADRERRGGTAQPACCSWAWPWRSCPRRCRTRLNSRR
ncbi:hypothetical protein QJS66_21710 [Kocuria rhizophila]|nr:hypothetical protein QJS66_21710 [Kocuria rhizophila]